MMKPLFCLLVLCASSFAQSTISDKFPLGAGSLPWYKSLVISWPAYSTPFGHAVAAGSQTVTIAADGSFSVRLPPSDSTIPQFEYTVQLVLQNGGPATPTAWMVPTTPRILGLSQVVVALPNAKSGVVLTQLRCAACRSGDVPTFNGSQFQPVNVAAFEEAGSAAAVLGTSVQKSANLSDLPNRGSALANLGGVTATQAASAAPVQTVSGRSGNIALSTNDILGLGTVATHAVSDFEAAGTAAAVQTTVLSSSVQKSANLSDVPNPSQALANLGGVTATQAATAAPVQTVAGVSPAGGNVNIASTNLSDTASLVRSSTTAAQSFSGPITAPQSNSVFNVDGFPASGCTVGGTAYTTQLDCANATANAWVAANAQSATLFFGNSGVYATCTGVTLPATSASIASLSLIGQGRGWQHGAKSASQIKQVCGISTAVVSKAAGTTTYLYPELTINNIEINANNLAPACLDLYGVSGDYQNISCFGINGSDHFIKIGDNATAQGGAYEVFARNIKVDGGAIGTGGSGAAYAAAVSGGAISSFSVLQGISAITVTNGGSGYATNATITFNGGTCPLVPQAFISAIGAGGAITAITVAQAGACSVAPASISITGGSGAATSLTSVSQTGTGYSSFAKVALYGYGSSLNQTQPCTTMPTNPVVISADGAGHITGLSLKDATLASTGAGCSGTVDVQVQDVYPSSYGIVINSTDSDYDNLIVQKAGQIAGIVVNHSQNTFKHPHCYGSQPVCIQDWGGNDYTAVEGDVVAHYSLDLEGTGTTVRGAKAFANAYVYLPGMAKYYISPAATNMSISESSTLTGPIQPDEHTFVAIGGVLDTVTVAGTSTFVSGASMPSSDDLQTNSFRIMAQGVVDGPGGGSFSFFNGSLVIGNKLGKFGDSSGSQFVPGSITTASALQRNSADPVAALQIQQKNTGSTGDIVDFGNTTGTVSSIDVNGALTIGTVAAQPGCDGTARGKFWIVRGVPDHLQVCIQSTTSGTYAWKQVF